MGRFMAKFYFSGILLLLLFPPAQTAMANDRPYFFDIGVGAGSDLLHGLGTKQVLIAPALNWQVRNLDSLWIRFEGDVEAIHHHGKMTFVFGAAPLLRWFPCPGQTRYGPFAEGGVGVNLISRCKMEERDLGGGFIFSPMASVGYAFPLWEKPATFSLRYRHVSNAGLYSENAGLDSLYLLMSFAF